MLRFKWVGERRGAWCMCSCRRLDNDWCSAPTNLKKETIKPPHRENGDHGHDACHLPLARGDARQQCHHQECGVECLAAVRVPGAFVDEQGSMP